MTELDPLRKRVKELEDQFRNLMTGEGFSVGSLQDAGVPDHWEFRYPPRKQGTGACCFSDGSCSVLDVQSCRDAGGTFLANGTTCSPNPCSDFCTGACCRDDGSCDIQRESVCTAGGGTWQGCGTDCDPNPCSGFCTGACCHTDGSCNISTQSVCVGSGGAWQGCGTTCGGVDCSHTGACCHGTTCDIETESDCTGSGGTYLGDGTTCDPNPCPVTTICCDTPFSGFLGSGMYMVMTDHVIRTAHTEPTAFTDGCDLSTDITTTTTLTRNMDGTCTSTVTCSGTSSYVNITHPTLEFANCSWVSDGFGGCIFHLDSGAGGISCNAECFGPCGCSPSTVSNTEQTCTSDLSNMDGDHCHYEETITLSNECTF